MSPAVTIRAATKADADAISALIVSAAEQEVTATFDATGRANFLDSLTPDAIRGYLAGDYRYFVAEAGGELQGVIALRGEAHIFHLFVVVGARRRGVASALWHHARRASEEGFGVTGFTVNSSQFAESFYRRHGFVRSGEVQDYRGVVAIPMALNNPQKSD